MNPYRYVPLGDDVYVDQWGQPPTRPDRLATVLVSCVALLVLFYGGYALFAKTRANEQRTTCVSNLKEISLGLMQYAQDNDERLPPVDAAFYTRDEKGDSSGPTAYGWAGAITPYIFNYGAYYHCPAANHKLQENLLNLTFIDYWFNDNMATIQQSSLASPRTLLMLGEGNDGVEVTDPSYSLGELPSDWLSDQSKPPYRHLGGANYAFADGHVAWLRPVHAPGDFLAQDTLQDYTLQVTTNPVPHRRPPHPAGQRTTHSSAWLSQRKDTKSE
ncbi:MAG: DUF1559 domain-containing protein [Abitibacteriaceae bacterium]|nr:DUF1559 domain-containing protein [Abditibacteriaceae bacterium]